MSLSNLKEEINNLPDESGAYFFRDKENNILYIGKATSLKSRVKSYLSSDLIESRGERIVKMTQETEKISFEKTDSVLEALVLEAYLIKKHRPKYNVLEKDDKSYNFVVISKEKKDGFPKLVVMRGKDILSGNLDFKIAYSFGPFTQGKSLKVALKIIRKIFPFRDKCEPNLNGKPCFNYELGLCPGMCAGKISAEDYRKNIKNIVLFFEGKKKKILSSFKKEMALLAKQEKFEEAEQIKRKIFALEHIQDVALISDDLLQKGSSDEYRIESYDIAHLSGDNVVGVMTVVSNGEARKNEYRKFKIRGGYGNNDVASLTEVIERRLEHNEWEYPKLIVVDGGIAQKNAIESVLEKTGISIPVVSVLKDERHKPKQILGDKKIALEKEADILLANSESHRFAITYHRNMRNKNFRLL